MSEKSIVNRFKEAAEKYPDRIAVEYCSERVTYRELDRLSDLFAANLLQINKGCSKVIGLRLEKDISFVTAALGTLKVGLAYMPVSMMYPAERVRKMLRISGAGIIVGREDSCPVDDAVYCCFDNMTEECGNELPTDVTAEAAYVIFTSGSTGDPKGIVIRHSSVCNLIDAMNDIMDGSYDVIGCNAPVCFDMSVAQIYYSLFGGKKLVLIPDDIKNIPDILLDHLRSHNVQICDFTPTHLMMIMKYAGTRDEEIVFPPEIISAGEAFPVELAKSVISRLLGNNGRILNCYGPTEACVYASYYVIDSKNVEDMTVMKIGVPLRNYGMFIRNSENRVCPNGIEGEICITGAGLSTGYCGNKELTDKVFTAAPKEIGERMYCTGDLGYISDDGNIVCLGRNDDQVKIRGYRIELGEIEKALLKCSGIRQAKVLPVGENSGKNLIAFCVSDTEPDEKNITAELSRLLPDYMIPARIIRTDRFETTVNGKTDKAKLLSLLERGGNERNNTEDIESFVISVCAEILGYSESEIFPDDDFFLLGGNSIGIMELYSVIHDVYDVSVDIVALYENSKLRAIGAEIGRCLAKENTVSVPYAESADMTWIHTSIIKNEDIETKKKISKYGMEFPAYNILHSIEADEPLDYERFREAAMIVIWKHGAFGTVYERSGRSYKMVRSGAELRAENIFSYVYDAADLSDEELRSRAKVFDPQKAPLIQIVFFEKDGRQRILFNVHHGIFDYFSMKIFIREIMSLYGGRPVSGKKTDYVSILDHCNKRDSSAYADFWREYLSGRQRAAEFVPDLGKCSSISLRESSFTVYDRTVDGELADAFRKKCKSSGVTEFTMLITLYAVLMSSETGCDDFFLGTYVPGRDNTNSNAIGLFAKLVPVRFRLDLHDDLSGLLDNVNGNLRRILNNQFIELHEIYHSMSAEDCMKGELFSVIFNYVNDITINSCGREICCHECGDEPEKMPFSLKIFSGADGFRISTVACDKMYSDELIERINDKYMELIRMTAFCTDDELPLLKH